MIKQPFKNTLLLFAIATIFSACWWLPTKDNYIKDFTLFMNEVKLNHDEYTEKEFQSRFDNALATIIESAACIDALPRVHILRASLQALVKRCREATFDKICGTLQLWELLPKEGNWREI